MIFGVLSGLSSAAPIVTGSILNNGQIVGPTDPVTIRVRIENSGDMPFNLPGPGASGSFATPNNYDGFSFPNSIPMFPNFVVSPLGAGASIDFDFFTLFPVIGGAAPGQYVTSGILYLIYDDNLGNTEQVNFEPARWTVAGNSVPEPASLALIVLGLAGLGFSRRKRAS